MVTTWSHGCSPLTRWTPGAFPDDWDFSAQRLLSCQSFIVQDLDNVSQGNAFLAERSHFPALKPQYCWTEKKRGVGGGDSYLPSYWESSHWNPAFSVEYGCMDILGKHLSDGACNISLATRHTIPLPQLHTNVKRCHKNSESFFSKFSLLFPTSDHDLPVGEIC